MEQLKQWLKTLMTRNLLPEYHKFMHSYSKLFIVTNKSCLLNIIRIRSEETMRHGMQEI